ncbi:DUF4834 domain-containing protein [Spirosoma taeanense]|uniref:DUF4834 domain-containing protein n=1 Tax=Spirosoma taeanense TaxID=2735870 RepID=A0A6M5Y4A6_9BACT|nr:DUF4834 domain-containing protein [Spirosoma taeanense]QJW88244.1 DUF4834 domain-containing protein [Spirosoma taeanense]
MLFKYLFIITLIILFVPPVRRFVFYLLVGRQLVKEQKRHDPRSKNQRDGEVKVHVRPSQDETRYKGGEYVDYEEIK